VINEDLNVVEVSSERVEVGAGMMTNAAAALQRLLGSVVAECHILLPPAAAAAAASRPVMGVQMTVQGYMAYQVEVQM